MDHFYLTLPSNSSLQYYGRQSLAHYRTRLSKTIQLNVSAWEVGLSEIIYPLSWHNIYDAKFRVRKIVNNNWEWIEGEISDGFYKDIPTLVECLEDEIKNILDGNDKISFVYNHHTRKIKIYIKQGYAIILSNALSQPLGFGDKGECEISHLLENEKERCDTIRLSGDTVTSTFIADVNRGLQTLFVHCNLVQPQLVGDQSVPLLRTVAVKGHAGDVVAESFTNVHYMGVERSSFQEIEIHITDDTGKTITFQQGRVIVKLHFKRK